MSKNIIDPETRYANDDFIILDHLRIMNRFITINFVEWYFVLKQKFRGLANFC